MLHVVSGDAGLARLRHEGFQGRVAWYGDRLEAKLAATPR
jgi:hypothetical protein